PFLMTRTSPLWVVTKTRPSGATAMAVVLPMLFATSASLKPVGSVVGMSRCSNSSKRGLNDGGRQVFFPPRMGVAPWQEKHWERTVWLRAEKPPAHRIREVTGRKFFGCGGRRLRGVARASLLEA